MNPEAIERLIERNKNRPRPTHCHQGHEFTPDNTIIEKNGVRRCKICRKASRSPGGKTKRRSQASQVPGLVPFGKSIPSIKAWATRRERYGGNGLSAEAKEKILKGQAAARKKRPQRTTCFKGHKFTPANTVYQDGGDIRRCRICRDISRRGRPQWLEIDGTRISLKTHDDFMLAQLTQRLRPMIESHPDRNGTDYKFREARRKLFAFLKTEESWYRQHGIPMPDKAARWLKRAV
jgi:hypothetical protein